MDILPAIDILGGKAVRLAKGDYNAVTVYNDDPAAQAALFKEQGARWIHVVDLDGARSGVPENIDIIERIIKETGLKIEVKLPWLVGARAQAFPPKSLLPKWASLVSNTWCIPIFPAMACRRALMQLAMSKLRACLAILLLRRAV